MTSATDDRRAGDPPPRHRRLPARRRRAARNLRRPVRARHRQRPPVPRARDQSRELEIASNHKSEFLASMSHELRTPLNAVIGFSEVLLERMFGEINERQEEYLRDIWNSGRHLLELLNEILDLSKVEAGHMTLDPSDLLRSAARSTTRWRWSANAPPRTASRISVEIADDVGDDRRRRAAVQTGRPEPVVQRGQVHPRRRQRVGPRPPDRRRTRGHGDRQRHRRAAGGSGQDLRLLPAGSPRTRQGRGHRARVDAVAADRRPVRRPDVAGKHCRRGKYVRVLRSPRPRPVDATADAGATASSRCVVLVDDDRASLDLMAAYLDDAPVQVLRASDGVRPSTDLARWCPPRWCSTSCCRGSTAGRSWRELKASDDHRGHTCDHRIGRRRSRPSGRPSAPPSTCSSRSAATT